VLILIRIISTVGNILTILVFVDIILSYFMSYDHPVRRALDSVVEPMLIPIRRLMPTMGGLDFSPMVLIIVIQLAQQVLIRLIVSFA
jgi:YggT family protein